MAHGPHRPRVGELWRLTALTAVGIDGNLVPIPTGTPFTVLSRHEGTLGWESRVLFGVGLVGDLSDHCLNMTRISDEAR